jgi:imidazolonepropionase-like amidohydrolase
MSRLLEVPIALLAVVCTAGIGGSAPPTADLAIVHATVVDVAGGRLLPAQTVLIGGGHIRAIGPSHEIRIPQGARILDARSKYLIPGLIDSHVHFNPERDSVLVARLLSLYLTNGITAVREASTRGQELGNVALRRAVDAGRVLGPRIYVSGRVDAAAARPGP